MVLVFGFAKRSPSMGAEHRGRSRRWTQFDRQFTKPFWRNCLPLLPPWSKPTFYLWHAGLHVAFSFYFLFSDKMRKQLNEGLFMTWNHVNIGNKVQRFQICGQNLHWRPFKGQKKLKYVLQVLTTSNASSHYGNKPQNVNERCCKFSQRATQVLIMDTDLKKFNTYWVYNLLCNSKCTHKIPNLFV